MARRRNKGQISQPVPNYEDFNLDIRIVKSGKCGVAKPTEAFWTAWRESKAHLLNAGFKVTKEKDWVVEVPINFVEKCSAPVETMPDHLEKGLMSPAAAANLKSETPDEYDQRRDFEEDGDGSYYPSYGDIRGIGGR